jgi:hypothetical protein
MSQNNELEIILKGLKKFLERLTKTRKSSANAIRASLEIRTGAYFDYKPEAFLLKQTCSVEH